MDTQNKPLSVRVPPQTKWAASSTSEDPMSPYGRIMEDMGFHIVVVMGLGEPVNLPVFRAGIETELLPRFPRFRCIQVILFASFPFQFHIFIVTQGRNQECNTGGPIAD